MLQTTHKGLSGTALKTIALVLMLMDHIHYFFEFTGCIPEWFSMLARLSAPLFLFCTVEGFAHTHDRKRYFFRIWCIRTDTDHVKSIYCRPCGCVLAVIGVYSECIL